MAFVRSPRGVKSRFSVARISSCISRAYIEAMGPKASLWRRQIQTHAQTVALTLRQKLGDGNGVEWSRSAIRSVIEEELRRNAPPEVHERFLDSQRTPRVESGSPAERWDRFEAFPDENPDQVDPVWSVNDTSLGEPYAPEPVSPLEELGTPAKPRKTVPRSKAPAHARRDPVRRTHWVEFWRALAQQAAQPFDFHLLERQIQRMPPSLRHLDSEGWWDFWQNQIDVAMKSDPRLVALLRLAQERRERAQVVGGSWLDGTGLDGKEGRFLLAPDLNGQEAYRALWREHMADFLQSEEAHSGLRGFDLGELAKRMQPQRDRLIDWRGAHWLATAEGLWALERGPWRQGGRPHPTARELPQWAWMRTAMALALGEDQPMARALEFYEAFSTLAVIPSETMLREAGKRRPRFLEDEAGIVGDRFESIHGAIHRAAIGTKWTGTMALDWRRVRAQGAPIAGRRLSQGPIGFMRSIHMTLAAQGRQGEDRPVTVTLPLWHRDIEAFLDGREESLARLQCVVSVPDLFFQRLQDGGQWVLMDPAAFPELGESGRENYIRAENRWAAAAAHSAEAIAGKAVPAEKLWRRLTEAMERGSPFLTFEGSDRAFSPFPDSAPPLGGIDGVGAIPVPTAAEMPFVAWPAAAVDLSKTLGPEGNPDPQRMRAIAAVAMRVLDNAISLCELPEDNPTSVYRPVCLGAVGFFEAINQSSSSGQNDADLTTAWVSSLAEAWAAVVLMADQQLRKERGAAPAWSLAADARPFDPLSSTERLREARNGSLGHRPRPRQEWGSQKFKHGHRCSVRTVWAPFLGAARVAGVTPGGMGTLRPVEQIVDERGQVRWAPTPLLIELIAQRPEDLSVLREAMRHPTEPRKWPAFLVNLTYPSPEGWERRLLHAANIRPWIDQGVSLTLPAGLPPAVLRTLVKRAWWLGLSNVRFEGAALTLAETGMDKTSEAG